MNNMMCNIKKMIAAIPICLLAGLLLTSCGGDISSGSVDTDKTSSDNVSSVTFSPEDYEDHSGYRVIKNFDALPDYFDDLRFVERVDKSNYVVKDIRENEIFSLESIYPPYFSESLACFCVDDKYGFVDINGEVVIEPQYDFAGGLINGSCVVQDDGRKFYIDKNGNECEDTSLVYPHVYSDDLSFGYIDENGEVTILEGADRLFPFSNGYAIVREGVEEMYFIDENYDRVTGNLYEQFVDVFTPAQFADSLNAYEYVFEGGYAILNPSGYHEHIVIKIEPELYSDE